MGELASIPDFVVLDFGFAVMVGFAGFAWWFGVFVGCWVGGLRVFWCVCVSGVACAFLGLGLVGSLVCALCFGVCLRWIRVVGVCLCL